MADVTNVSKIKGKVKWFNLQKGYGYITDDDGNDHFVHFSNIVNGKTFIGLDPEDEVEFDIGNGKTGEQAVNVSVVNSAKKPNKKYSKN
jgi:CspA family cold shock protein